MCSFAHPHSAVRKARVPTFTCGSWDNVVWVILVMRLLFHLGRLVESGDWDQPVEWGRSEGKSIYLAVFIENFGLRENDGLQPGVSPWQFVLGLSQYDKYLF